MVVDDQTTVFAIEPLSRLSNQALLIIYVKSKNGEQLQPYFSLLWTVWAGARMVVISRKFVPNC
jgi:hypothetical protein